MVLVVKKPPAKQETWVQSLGLEDPLEEGLARIPWTEESSYSPWGCKESDSTEVTWHAQGDCWKKMMTRYWGLTASSKDWDSLSSLCEGERLGGSEEMFRVVYSQLPWRLTHVSMVGAGEWGITPDASPDPPQTTGGRGWKKGAWRNSGGAFTSPSVSRSSWGAILKGAVGVIVCVYHGPF